jgi:hypothetical protein
MRAPRWLRDQDARVLFVIIAVVVIPAMFTLNTVKLPLAASDVKQNPTPLGYTVSLLIYLVPVLTLYWWFSRRCDEGDGPFRRHARAVLGRFVAPPSEYRQDYRRSAYRRTLLTLIPVGFLLDIVFGHAFLTFENKQATLTVIPLFPAFDFSSGRFVAHIPVEEFVFYTLGFLAILSVYVWCDEYWLEKYNVPDYEVPPRGNRGLPPFIAQLQIRTPLLIALALLAAAWAYKRFLAAPRDARVGFPSYFTFLVLASLFPAILLFRSTQRFINWRAVSFTVLWVVLTSLIWEATLAAPYGWWGYQPFHMVGLYVGAWFKLPIEAVLLWVSATFTTVMVYEAYKILISMKRVCGVDWRTAMFGPRSVGEWAKEQLSPAPAGSEVEHPEGVFAEEAARGAGDRP